MANGKIAQADWRWPLIRHALACAPGSRERAEAIRTIAAQTHHCPDGRERRLSQATLYRWVADYEARGEAAIRRKPRADTGQRKAIISPAWDSAVTLNQAAKEQVRDQLLFHVKRLYRSGLPSRRQIQYHATELLIRLTAEAGCELPEKLARRVCKVSARFVRTQRHYRHVAIMEKDAKRFYDESQPRARRNRHGMKPMMIVCADVHHVDVILERADGSRYTPKMIAFLDLATQRLFIRTLFFEPGRMVRQADVIEAFVAMTQHPDWGMPAELQVDHGKEFAVLGFIDDALKLARRARAESLTIKRRQDGAASKQVNMGFTTMASAIHKALANNPAAKPIEGILGVLERTIFPMIPGWIGGDRMNPKKQKVGKPPVAFRGSPEELSAMLDSLIGYYHELPQSGTLDGMSPREAFERAVGEGWERIEVDPDALLETFAEWEPRTVRQGEVRRAGRRYGAPELLTLPPRSVIEVAIPKWGDGSRLAARYDDGPVFFLEDKNLSGFLDRAGAQEGHRLRREQRNALRAMGAEAPPLDLVAEASSMIDRSPRPVARSAGIIGLDKRAEEAAAARRRLPAPRERKALGVNPMAERWRALADGRLVVEHGPSDAGAATARPDRPLHPRMKGGSE